MIYIMLPVTFGLIIGRFIWVSKQVRSGNYDIRFSINNRTYESLPGIRCRQFLKFVFSEVLLNVLYVSAAFLCRLLMNNNWIRWITFARWLIEASFLPYSLGFYVSGSYFNWWEDFFTSN